MTAPLCFIDTETTGLHPDRRAWEIALIRRDLANDGSVHEETRLIQIRDVDLSNAEPGGLKVGGFYERHQQYRPPPRSEKEASPAQLVTEQQAAYWAEKLTRGAHLVGCVPDFDARTLDPMLRRHGLIPAWHHHLIDIEAMAVGWLNAPSSVPQWPITPPWRSDDLSMMCGVEPPSEEDRHTAMGDALWVQRWYDALVGAR